MTTTIYMQRFALLDEGTLGSMVLPSGLKLYTIERPWLNNEPFVSCIPDGDYELEWDTTGRIKNVPRLRGTEPRTQINIHVANWPHELQGCIGLGTNWSLGDGRTPHVVDSIEAEELFKEQIRPVRQEDKSPMMYNGKEGVTLSIRSKKAG